MTGCSAESQRISAEKREIDQQRDAQIKIIDDRTAELKREIDLRKTRSDDLLEQKKREQGADKAALDNQKKEIDHNSDLAKQDIDRQADAAKKQVNIAADRLKSKLAGKAPNTY
jgi:hypothetical protein